MKSLMSFVKSIIENGSSKDKDKAERSIAYVLIGGFIMGIIALIGFPVATPGVGASLIYIGLLLSLASFVTGFFTGILFGIPKRNEEENKAYTLNNSLVEISEWLTKIIVGLGLVNLTQIPPFLINLGNFVSEKSGSDEQSVSIFAICIVIYFGVFGLYIGYNYMRLVLSQKYKASDEALQQKLEQTQQEKAEVIAQANTMFEAFNKMDTPFEKQKTVVEKSMDKEIQFVDQMVEKAKVKLQKGLASNNIDPQKGQWGGVDTKNSRILKGTVTDKGLGLFQISLKVTSTDDKKPIANDDVVLFALHQTFGNPPFRLIHVVNGTAELRLLAYGSFTVGAFVDKGQTELELDLAELPGVTEYFKTH